MEMELRPRWNHGGARPGRAGAAVVIAAGVPLMAVIVWGFAGVSLVAIVYLAGTIAICPPGQCFTPTLGELATLVCAGALAGAAAIGIHLLQNSDLAVNLPYQRPSSGLLISAVIFLALVNAVVEELAWRSLPFVLGLRHRLPAAFVVLVTSVSFGLAHYRGVPAGPFGIVAASTFGAAMGILRVRSRSLVAPIVVHFGADIVIIGVLARFAVFGSGFRYVPR